MLLYAALTACVPPLSAADDTRAYPTEDMLWYGFACIEKNGPSPLTVQRCACAIETLQAQLPYEEFTAARTVAALQGVGGERAQSVLETTAARRAVEAFVVAQRAANKACF